MGALGKIRNRSGLLLTVIGFAMLAFILGDFMQSQRSGSTGTLYVGKVLDENIHIKNFEKTVDIGIENWKSQNPTSVLNQSIISNIRNQAWNQLTRELIMEEEYSKLGISISDDEWMERISGLNVHPEVSKIQAFQDPNNGQFDRNKVLAYLQQVEQDQTGESVKNWLNFQDYLINVLRNTKYDILVEKGSFINSKEAMISFNEGIQVTNYDYLSIPYSSIDDSLIEISNKEIKKFYNNNKDEKYKQKLSKDVEYVVFSVIPTKDDDNQTKESIEKIKDDLFNFDDYVTLVRRNSDNNNTIFNFQTKESFKNDSAFSLLIKKDKGTVIGPYKTNSSTYRIAKLVDVQRRPDSVQARHILISPTASKSLDSVKTVINKLKKRINSGEDFSSIAQKFSDDKTSAIKGGELGWFPEGQMVDLFNEVCFTSEVNDLEIVETQFGVHLIQLTNKSKLTKKYKVVFIDRNVSASTETYNNYYTQAAQFVSQVLNNKNPFDSIVNKENLVKRSDVKVEPNKENITGLPNSRSIIKWMNKANVGDVSEVFEFDNTYVVAKLTKENKEGYKTISDVENSIREEIKAEKKYNELLKKFKKDSSLEDLSEIFNATIVNDIKGKLSSLSVSGLGYVPEVVGAVFGTNIGAISDPVKSQSSLIIIRVNSRDDYRDEGDFSQEQNSMTEKAKNYVITSSFRVLQEDANLVDNRSEIY
tara:strand:+ start:56 stop:2164 length:2109 start_codon:yes stop_codon:yes gene_type:complete